MTVSTVLGAVTDVRFAGRNVDPLAVAWGDAKKHRQVVRTGSGRELALQLPRGTFLADGLVLWDDGETVVVVRRPLENAIVLAFADNTGVDAARRALLLGYHLGNQHAPLEVSTAELRTPLMTGAGTAEDMLRDLGLNGEVRQVALAAHGWSATSADPSHRHSDE